MAVVLPGCGPRLPPKTDVQAAREALVKSLDVWVAGKSVDALKSLKPRISFRDANWENGATLVSYEIEREETAGQSGRFTVKESLVDKAGVPSARIVTYIADGGPMIVIRPEF